MQKSLTRFLDKKSKRGQADGAQLGSGTQTLGAPRKATSEQRPGSRLVQALNSQLRRPDQPDPAQPGLGSRPGASKLSQAAGGHGTACSKAGGPAGAEQSSSRGEAAGPPDHHHHHQQQQQPAETRPCPLCGQLVEVATFEAHLQQELTALDEEEEGEEKASAGGFAADAQGPQLAYGTSQQQQQQQGPLHRPARLKQQQQQRQQGPLRRAAPKKPRLLVLGGQPQATAPTNPRALEWCQWRRQQRQREQAGQGMPAFNHFNDGAGFLDGDEIGIDGAENAGLNWEGMGSCIL